MKEIRSPEKDSFFVGPYSIHTGMRRKTKLVVQGFPGSFHDEAARDYFGHNRIEVVPAKSFNRLAQILEEDIGMLKQV